RDTGRGFLILLVQKLLLDFKSTSPPCRKERANGGAPTWSIFFLGRRWQQSIQPQIHCRGAVVVGPTAGQTQECPGTRTLFSVEPLDVLVHLGIVSLGKRGPAELERSFHRRDPLFLRFFPSELHLRLRNVADIRAEEIVCVGDMSGQMAESHLVGCGFVIVLVGGHFLECGDDVLLATVEHLTQGVRSGRFGLCGGHRGKQQDQHCRFHKFSGCAWKNKSWKRQMSNAPEPWRTKVSALHVSRPRSRAWPPAGSLYRHSVEFA